MQSSNVVDALSEPRENILTRRANQWHHSTIAQFVSPMALPIELPARLHTKNPNR